jgi:hypothetical protein
MNQTKLAFAYRSVGYGTRFEKCELWRPGDWRPNENAPQDQQESEKRTLCFNEIAVDVGSNCLGYKGYSLRVFDHHFQREDLQNSNFGSAALTVLSQAHAVADWARVVVGSCHPSVPIATVWLVSHVQPDFDAYCSCYVASRLIQDPELAVAFGKCGVSEKDLLSILQDSQKIQKVLTKLSEFPASRSLLLLAVCAARVDQCIPDACPRDSSLRCLFLAARERGRFRPDRPNGSDFFADVEAEIFAGRYHPLLDELPTTLMEKYAPERLFIKNQEIVYLNDMQCAKILSVPICGTNQHYRDWSGQISGSGMDTGAGIPFWRGSSLHPFFQAIREGDPELAENVRHQDLARNILDRHEDVDGLLIDKPNCLFFKDWVRLDTARSPRGFGFKFTGIVHAQPTPQFYFSLDPEFARSLKLHLYDLWVRLQQREGVGREIPDGKKPRGEILARGSDGRSGLLDPWFDGYEATLVVSPNSPSEAVRQYVPKIDSDPTMKLVEAWASNGFYRPKSIALIQWSCPTISRLPECSIELSLDTFREAAWEKVGELKARREGFILANLKLKKRPESVGWDKFSEEQVGKDLWRLISTHPNGVPPDFLDRHLVVDVEWIAVWNRNGLAIAFKNSGKPGSKEDLEAESLSKLVMWLTSLASVIKAIGRVGTSDTSKISNVKSLLKDVREAQENLVKLESTLSGPGDRAFRRLMENFNLSGLSERIADLAEGHRDEDEADRERLIGDVLAVASIAGLVLAYFQVEGVKWFGDAPEKRVKVYTTGGIGAAILLVLYLFSRKNIWKRIRLWWKNW